MKLPTNVCAALEARIAGVDIDTCYMWQDGRMAYAYERTPATAGELHRINSVTKSVLSILLGIAIDDGAVASVGTPIAEWLPGVPKNKAALTLEHLLTMSPGFDWQEMGSWGGLPRPMMNSGHWRKFILGREMKDEPGQRMIYNSGASHLLGEIVQRATGQPLAVYARQRLFEPLGIERFHWPADPHGIMIGGFGLSLAPADLLRIGRLMLQCGVWKGRRIVSERWVEASTRPRLHTYDHLGSYGYHWWLMTDPAGVLLEPAVYFAMGFAGQFIFVVPDAQLAASFTSRLPKEPRLPMHLFRELVVGALAQR